jgi:L-malate glycosyltransferase
MVAQLILVKCRLQVSIERLGIPDNAFVIGMVARGIPEKGWSEMVDAFEAMNRPDAHLVLVGDGPAVRSLVTQVRNPRIHFVGKVIDPFPYIRHFDIGCLPSLSESLPTVLIEYLSCGVPTVATRVGDVAKMLKADSPEGCGLVVDFAHPTQIAPRLRDALCLLYDDRKLLQRLKANTADAARAFDMKRCIDSYIALYQSLVVTSNSTLRLPEDA